MNFHLTLTKLKQNDSILFSFDSKTKHNHNACQVAALLPGHRLKSVITDSAKEILSCHRLCLCNNKTKPYILPFLINPIQSPLMKPNYIRLPKTLHVRLSFSQTKKVVMVAIYYPF